MNFVTNYQIGHSSDNTDNIRIVLKCNGDAGVEVPFSHRHKFHAIYWIHRGTGSHAIDFEDYEIKPNRIFYIKPEQIHYMKCQSEVVYSAVQFSDEFRPNSITENSLLSINDFPVYADLTDLERIKIQNIFEFLYNEYNDKYINSKQIIEYGINIILLLLGRIGVNTQTGSNIPETVIKFKQLVNENFLSQRCVTEYACMLNVTPNYLNVLSQKYLGESALSIIHGRVILEIKRLLLRTNCSISEIAYLLNFNELSYFSRFFKNKTGITPNAFRTVMNNLYQS